MAEPIDLLDGERWCFRLTYGNLFSSIDLASGAYSEDTSIEWN